MSNVSNAQLFVQLGRVIRERRRLLGLSQADVSRAIKCNRSYVSEIECGKQNITIRLLRELAGILQCKASTLVRSAEKADESFSSSSSSSSRSRGGNRDRRARM